MHLLPQQTDTHTCQITNTGSHPAAASAPALVDTLRAGGPVAHAAAVNNRHPLESRLAHWDASVQQMHMDSRRRLHGLADPVKREMELLLVSHSEHRPLLLGGSACVHTDILRNKDWSLDWEDVYPDRLPPGAAGSDIHDALEQRLAL